MQRTWETPARRSDHTYLVVVLGFIVLVLGTIGFAFFLHEKKVREQRALYSAYIAQNKWRAPTKAAWEQAKIVFARIESIDPEQESTAANIDMAIAELRKAKSALWAAPIAASTPGIWAPGKASNVFSQYEGYLDDIRIACAQNAPQTRTDAVNRVAHYLYNEWRYDSKIFRPPTQEEWESKMKYFQAQAALLDEATTKKMLLERVDRRGWSRHDGVSNFEEFWPKCEVIPEGLNLEYVRRYVL